MPPSFFPLSLRTINSPPTLILIFPNTPPPQPEATYSLTRLPKQNASKPTPGPYSPSFPQALPFHCSPLSLPIDPYSSGTGGLSVKFVRRPFDCNNTNNHACTIS